MKISQKELDNRLDILEYRKQEIYKNNLDNLTCRMTRKKLQNTWTEQDKQEYNNAYLKCNELIKEQESLLIPKEIQIVTDSEYEKLLALEEAKKAKLEEELNGTEPTDTADTADTTEKNIER